jgi:hypothetical protein
MTLDSISGVEGVTDTNWLEILSIVLYIKHF